MRKIIITLTLLSLIVFSMSIIACTDNVAYTGNDTYTDNLGLVYKGDLIFYLEETSQLQIYGEHTSYDGVNYAFEYTIPTEEREDCVKISSELLNRIGYKEPLSINVLETKKFGDNTYIADNVLYTYRQDFENVDYAAKIINAVYGKYCNYGLSYGYANYLLNDLGYENGQAAALAELDDKYLYDMNILCFSSAYASEEQVTQIQNFSTSLVNEYIKNYGENSFISLLSKTGDTADIIGASESLNAIYSACGIDYTSTPVLYTFGGKGNDFVAKSQFAEFYINDGWTDNATLSTYPGNFVDESFLHSDYNEVKTYFETITVDMGKFQEFFDMDEYNNDLTVIFYEGNTDGNVSFYKQSEHKIFLKTITSMMHEYIHSLTLKYAKSELWAVEGFARRYSILYDTCSIDSLNYEYNHPDPTNPELGYIDLYRNYIGRDIDVSVDADILIDFLVQYNQLFDANQSYASGASFIQYLEKQYGVQTAINYACSKNGEYAVLDKSQEELEAEWIDFLNESCAKYY